MATSDRALGSLMLFVAGFVFVYYSAWALLQPFLPSDSFLHDYFPPRRFVTLLPASLLLLAGTAVALFFASVILKESRKRKLKEMKRNA